MTGVIVLLSGGVESAVLAYRAARAGRLSACLHVDYGQPAAAEEARGARWIAAELGARLEVVTIPLQLGAMSDPAGASGPRVVPARNLTLIALGLNLAPSLGAGEVWYGACADDWAEYQDCRPSFVGSLNLALHDWRGGAWCRADAPLVWMSKREIITEARELGIDLSRCWSCYAPVGGAPCGSCGSCAARAVAG